MADRETKREDRTRTIIEAARKRFGQGSFEATTIRSIAEEAGVSVGVLYSHFQDKAALAEAISTEDLARETRDAFASLPQTGLRDQLNHIFAAFYEHHRSDMGLARIVIQTLSMAKDANSPLREQRFLELFMSLSNLVAEAQLAGEIVADVDPFDVAVNAFALHYFYLVGWLSGQPAFDPPEAHLDRALDLLLRGLQTELPNATDHQEA